MSSLGRLRSVTDGEHKVEIRSVVIRLHMSEGDDHLPVDKMPCVVDGGPAIVRQVFEVGSKADHVVIAVEITNHPSLFFAAYKLVGDTWQQQPRLVIDPEGRLKRVVQEGEPDNIRNVHRHFLRCCA